MLLGSFVAWSVPSGRSPIKSLPLSLYHTLHQTSSVLGPHKPLLSSPLALAPGDPQGPRSSSQPPLCLPPSKRPAGASEPGDTCWGPRAACTMILHPTPPQPRCMTSSQPKNRHWEHLTIHPFPPLFRLPAVTAAAGAGVASPLPAWKSMYTTPLLPGLTPARPSGWEGFRKHRPAYLKETWSGIFQKHTCCKGERNLQDNSDLPQRGKGQA